jgi:hypothetical protein
MLKLPSLTLITQKLALAAKRFPFSVMFIACLTKLLFDEGIIFLEGEVLPEEKEEYITRKHIFFSIGAILSITAVLWLEDFVSYVKQQIITIFIILLWWAYCFFLLENMVYTLSGGILESCAIGLAACLSILFASFLKKNKDRAFWNFSMQILFRLCLAISFGMIIFIVFCAMEFLFNVNIYEVLIIYFVLFTPLYIMANIPDKAAKHNEEISFNKSLKILARILAAFAAFCIVILYIILIKAIVAWEWPGGLLIFLISALAFSGLLIIMLLYPTCFEGSNIVIFLSRYFGLIILPLLALMTVCILHVLNDYGITIGACYFLLLNIWFYGIFIYLFIVKAKSIKWILISFAAIALLSSVGFWRVSNVTKHILVAELNESLGGKKIYTYKKTFFDEMKKEDRKKIKSNIKYLESVYGYKLTEQFLSYDEWKETFNTSVSINYRSHFANENVRVDYESRQFIIQVISDGRTFSIPLQEILDISRQGSEEGTFRYNFIYDNDYYGDEYEFGAEIFRYDDYTISIKDVYGECIHDTAYVNIYQFDGYLYYNK